MQKVRRLKCTACGGPITMIGVGRPRKYCSPACIIAGRRIPKVAPVVATVEGYIRPVDCRALLNTVSRTQNTLYQQLEVGHIRGFQIGNRWWVLKADVERYVAAIKEGKVRPHGTDEWWKETISTEA